MSNLIFTLEVLKGNPADSFLYSETIDRVISTIWNVSDFSIDIKPHSHDKTSTALRRIEKSDVTFF